MCTLYNLTKFPKRYVGLPHPQVEQVMGIEPTYPAWKAGALADVLHLQIKGYELFSHTVYSSVYVAHHILKGQKI